MPSKNEQKGAKIAKKGSGALSKIYTQGDNAMSVPSPPGRSVRRGFAPPKILPGLSDSGPRVVGPQRAKKVLFASAHSIVDFSNGASVATMDVLRGLCDAGFNCQAFCTPKLDSPDDVPFERVVESSGETYQDLPAVCGPERARVLYTRRGAVPITVIRLESTRQMGVRPEDIQAVLGFFRNFLEIYQPDVLLTYGGDPITNRMIDMARRLRIPVVFAIHNFCYLDPRPFANVDHCIVPSLFAQRYYRDQVGLDCHAISNPVDWDRVLAPDPAPQFVTFINPSLQKGAYAFVRIAHELARRRPDIPFLVVESRGTRDTLTACGFEAGACGNVRFMPNTSDPRQFWGVTRIALMPSLCWENQPLVVVEAMINGIPVIASDRGGTPEALGDCGFALPLPERMTPTTHILPTVEEVEPWVEAIVRLWDDPGLYEAQRVKARAEAQRWHPDRLRPLYAEFFINVQPQARPPILPKKNSGAGHSPSAQNGSIGKTYAPERPSGATKPVVSPPAVIPFSFVVCVSDEAILNANLMVSPCVARADSPHRTIVLREGPSAASGLNFGLERASHEWAVCVHQEVYLPEGWDRLLSQQLREAERRFGPVGVAGVYGVGDVIRPESPEQPLGAERIGWVVDRGRELRDGPELPARVAALDELLLVVRRDSGLRFDPALEFHLYGADLCLQARERGMAVVALGALCHHNSRNVFLPRAFFSSAEVLARKWSHRLPVAAPCVVIERGGAVHLLGNATPGHPSIAYALPNHGEGRMIHHRGTEVTGSERR
jgi:glycosyltransferase involved in cell wall biosynthesis